MSDSAAPRSNPFASAPLHEPCVFRTRAQREAHRAAVDAIIDPSSHYNAQRRRDAYHEWAALRTAEREAQRRAYPDVALPSWTSREQVEDYCRFLDAQRIPRNPHMQKEKSDD